MLEYLSVGFVLKPQGLKGEIKVQPLTDDINRFDSLLHVYIKGQGGYKQEKIESRRYNRGFVFLKLKGLNTIESVEHLRNQYLWIPRSMARQLPEDTFFIADIVGCSVSTTDGRELGNVKDVIQTGSNDVYVVEGTKGNVLIPALKKVVVYIKPREGRIIVDLTEMEGLLPDED
jgi:16S rRNA processing protein RimM